MIHKRPKVFVFLVVFTAYLATSLFIAAPQAQAACTKQYGGFFGFPTWYKYLNPRGSGANCQLAEMRQGEGGLDPSYFGRIGLALFEILLRVAAYAAVAFVMVGGFQFLISQGEPDKIAGARTTILNAIVGLFIAMFAVAIVNLVGNNIS